ncbi:hypothetical protein JYQ62_14980 [Nostoc sp. UHCC 0702]|nr:hypothetical protein JYQ62_14980 [Nostoc sp. UHCC 0702]
MKKYKFIYLSILSSILSISTNLFVSHLSLADSKDNTTETNTKNTDLICLKYPETEYPEAKSYCDALVNTKIIKSNQIWKNLTAINEQNKKIIWENNDKVNGRLLVVYWTTWDGYRDKVNQDIKTTRDTWITVAPELEEFCKQFTVNPKISLPYRINQLLGLAPENTDKIKKRKFVKFWVKKEDLFRPTPDPEITDHEAELNFPDLNDFIVISDKYKFWFLQQLMTNDYPWTKLGYTYDWGKHSDWVKIDPSRPVNVGLSEFIIRENATVKVDSLVSAEDYCK